MYSSYMSMYLQKYEKHIMRILLVEDEERIASAVKKVLELEGYAVDWVADGLKAEQRILMYRNEYDVVILDLMLPGKQGKDICKTVRGDGVSMPILVLTAKDMVDDKVFLLDSGADDYLVKPFAFEELLARLKALLRRPRESLPVELTVGTIVLDTKTRTATSQGKTMKLTAKEYALLEYFMRHPDEVVDRETILDHLWGFDFDSFSNVVDVHLKNLRKKIDRYRGKEVLETVRGMGYRLNSVY